jgi:flavin reductase (DIM6/NTAB) family NADH-FMN oxidoreductase RutF
MRLEAPALFLTGEQDPNSSPAMSQAMAAIAPRGRALIIPDERHMMNLTSPERINAALLEFLGGIGRGLPAIDDRVALRKALGSFVTGVTVIATRQADGQPRGFTANSFTSVSLDPPLILVCVSKSAASCAVFASARHFAVSILAEHQVEVSSLFASKAADKFERAAWRTGPEGNPVVSDAVAWFECRRDNVIDAGDHIVVIGRVIAYDYTSLNPLGYFRGAHATFGLSLDVLAVSGNRTLVGAILERAGSIVLIAGGDGTYDLPSGAALGHVNHPASLAGRLQQLGIKATLHFLFAVFDNPGRGYGAISIYYRGTLEELPPSDARVHLISFNSIPWQQLKDDAVRSMLRRYVRERSEDTFGIYVGDAERGTVRALAPG